VIFNKGAVMVLPASVNKATGLTAALRELRLPRNVLAVGDAENDHSFLGSASLRRRRQRAARREGGRGHRDQADHGAASRSRRIGRTISRAYASEFGVGASNSERAKANRWRCELRRLHAHLGPSASSKSTVANGS
jgi:hypothetical protein